MGQMLGGRVQRGRRGRRRWTAAAAGLALMLAAGCGDFFNKTTSGGSAGGGSSTTGSFAYVGTQSGNLVSYSVSAAGALATLAGSPYQLSTAAINSMAVTPNNALLYVAVAGTGVYGLAINGSTGVPTLINTSALVQDVSPLAVAVDPTGAFLLVAGLSAGAPAVGEYAINADGSLSEVSGSPVNLAFPSGTDTSTALVNGIAVAPSSSYVFVSMGQLGVAPLPFSTTGALSANSVMINPRTTSGVANQDMGLTVNAASTALFVGETNAGVRVFTVGSNTFTEITGSPFAAGGQPRSLRFDGSGDYLYSADTASNAIYGFSVLASGSLTALTGSPYSSVGAQPYGLALDQSKKYLLDVNVAGSPDLQLFSFDATTAGKLDPGATATNAGTAAAIATTH